MENEPTEVQENSLARGTPVKNLFTTRISHQILQYMLWKLEPFSKGQDALQISWNQIYVNFFRLLALIGKAVWQVQQYQALMFLVTCLVTCS